MKAMTSMKAMPSMKAMIGGLMGAFCVLVLSATAASAEVVCNRDGDCWHAREHAEYRPEFGVVVHPDNWKWAQNERYRWHEHDGRGYWRNGVWVEF
jgi:hypothetical protein